MIVLCSWDLQYHGKYMVYSSTVEPGNWKPITPLVLKLIKENQVKFSHGLCGSCYELVQKDIEFEERQKEFEEEK